ncbi:hypothetical protein ABGF26_02615 [Helcococcus ovis]|uniref:hypothetical protein n=1 Tax=Helcococcus ovis TaxID=72026 RepID=UPI0038BAADD6
MRKLSFSDLGKASIIVKKLGLRADKVEYKDVEALGASLFLKLIENYSNVENEVAEFMANLKGITQEEYKNQELDEVLEDFDELKKDQGLVRFFNSLKLIMNQH